MTVREIKFRAFHEEKREGMTFPRMIDWEELSEDDELYFFLKNQLADVSPVMQYTGLKDKNGIEIYEGDIVLVDSGRRQERVHYHISAGQSGYFPFLSSDYHWQSYASEVIGNIYQNPELLEVNK